MNTFNGTLLKHERPRGWIGVCLSALLALPVSVFGANPTIENTASVSYFPANQSTPVKLPSNTVITEVLPLPTPAEIEFRRYDPGAPGGTSMPIDGGQCLIAGSGFTPLPEPRDNSGQPLDPDGEQTGSAPGFYAGEPIVVAVTDINRNGDPRQRELIEVEITTTTGDAETLRLLETGEDTGVFAGAIQSAPIPPEATQYDCILSLADQATITARYFDSDFPLDAVATAAAAYAPLPDVAVLRMEQSVSRELVEVGDFLQYTLTLRNIHDSAPALNAWMFDSLPVGLRYRAGSLRIGADAAADPAIEGNGRTLRFQVGDLGPGESVVATFVAEVGPGARGPELVNGANGRASGPLYSNDTDTVVRMRESMLTSRFTIVGRVVEGSCDGNGPATPVHGVRLLLEDGTFVSTDENGSYHFAGVRPGTHVVQIDGMTLPDGLVAIPCRQNTRFAGRGFSQFVEGQGGSMLRVDFRLQRATGEVGFATAAERAGDRLRFTVDLDGGAIPVSSVQVMVAVPPDSEYQPGSARLDGAPVDDPQISDGIAIFDLGDPGTNWRRRLSFETSIGACTAGSAAVKAFAVFSAAGGARQRTSVTDLALGCDDPAASAASERTTTQLKAAAGTPAASPFPGQARGDVLGDLEADGGGDVDWFKDQVPGRGWLFPAPDYNPRAPATRVVFKSLPGDRVILRINGEEVSPLSFDGTMANASDTIAVGIWRGIDLVDGDNLLQAEVRDQSGQVVATMERTVHYANSVARAELVPGQSTLIADGIHKPVIAVRMLDRSGRPVRNGVQGEFSINLPYLPAESVQMQQNRQFAGTDGAKPRWMTSGDDGIAYIELAPTSTAGAFTLEFDFGSAAVNAADEEVKGWLQSGTRDWIVVGFARGSAGYETLADNMQALPEDEKGTGVRGKGQVALYAKGRVLGKWMLTIAYDSGKPGLETNGQSLLSTIDPQQYYTLYGDGSQQGYDAASVGKLYLKLERDQFYAMFGDFQTGLDGGELARYQRTLNGVKVEYHGPLLQFTGFAAETSQSYARDEFQGDGTSGLYRLSHAGLLMNSERVRIETRERYHSERIVETRDLQRHIDYDIDYDNGTLFFREPIPSRDFDFNPVFIVVEYETRGSAEEFFNAGGRVAARLMDGRLEGGVSYIRDENLAGTSRLVGFDARFRATEQDQVRAEAATTRGDPAISDDSVSGSAWLLEWEHRGDRLQFLAYARRNGPGFGLGQQNAVESGTLKAGVEGTWRIDERFALRGEAYRLENLGNGAVRDAASVEVAYRAGPWTARAGLQWAQDRALDGREAESRQLTIGASRRFLDDRLTLDAQAAMSIGGSNDSVDFPTRYQVGATYAITKAFNIVAAHEITDGEDRDTSTTRIGFETTPWKNAHLTSTINQSRISEYGPRTFALFGLKQKFLAGERWAFDVAVDSSRSFNESGEAPIVVDPAQPIMPGGIRDGGALTSDFVALSGGATYRAELWSWNIRAEGRHGQNDRYGLTSAFLRQVRDGVAFSASLQAFSQHNGDGSTGVLANAQLSWAYRPFGSRWSMLDKLEFRLDEIRRGAGDPILGQNTVAAVGDARSRRLVNNFVLNYVSDAWDSEGTEGVLAIDQRSQLSLYYGSKYVLDTFGTDDYAGYTDILGAEWRFDLTPKLDIGIRASVLHSWSQDSFSWAFGPSVGFTPFTNAWVSVGYNIRGFNDRDFENAHHTAQGPYMVFRMKFDQQSLGLDRASAPAGTP